LSKRREHDAVSRATGGDDLLDDGNFLGTVASRRDHDDERGPERFFTRSGQRLLARGWVSPR